MTKPKQLRDLPESLQHYVQEGTPFPDHRKDDCTKVEVLFAKQLRKKYFRNMALAEPGSQHAYPDFWQLMQYEVWHHVRTRLYPVILSNWEKFIDESPDSICVIWQNHFKRYHKRIEVASTARKNRLQAEARRTFLSAIYRDQRRLGIMESFALGRIWYGAPPGHNYHKRGST